MIGRDGLEQFCKELNNNRATLGHSGRYCTKLVGGKLTLVAPVGG